MGVRSVAPPCRVLCVVVAFWPQRGAVAVAMVERECGNAGCGSVECGNIECGNVECGNVERGDIKCCRGLEVDSAPADDLPVGKMLVRLPPRNNFRLGNPMLR